MKMCPPHLNDVLCYLVKNEIVPAHHTRDTTELLRCTSIDFIEPNLSTELTRPQFSGLWHLVSYSATCVWDQFIDELRQHPLHVWHGLEQSLIDDSVDQCWTCCLRVVFLPMVDIWTHLMSISLFSLYGQEAVKRVLLLLLFLYLMNFMFHTRLDAVGNILRVQYKSVKCDVSFSQGRKYII